MNEVMSAPYIYKVKRLLLQHRRADNYICVRKHTDWMFMLLICTNYTYNKIILKKNTKL